jgi:hypothetical protein
MHKGLLMEEVAQRKASLLGHQFRLANACNNLKKKDNDDWRFDLKKDNDERYVRQDWKITNERERAQIEMKQHAFLFLNLISGSWWWSVGASSQTAAM